MSNNSSLESLKGQRVLLMCAAFFYEGKLTAVNAVDVTLENVAIVYDTGTWAKQGYETAEKMGKEPLYVHRHAIEAFRVAK